MGSEGFLALCVSVASLTACTSVPRGAEGISEPQSGRFAYRDRLGSPFRDPASSREWLALSFGFLEREELAEDPVHDSAAFAIDGGFDLARGALRPAFEIGAAFSSHAVDDPADERIGLGRVSLGARLTYHGDRLRPYVRAGGFHRFVYDEEESSTLDLETNGWYVGAGIELLVEPGIGLGPFFTRYADRDDGPLEFLLGLSASFRL